jgi:hypothetical protein
MEKDGFRAHNFPASLYRVIAAAKWKGSPLRKTSASLAGAVGCWMTLVYGRGRSHGEGGLSKALFESDE